MAWVCLFYAEGRIWAQDAITWLSLSVQCFLCNFTKVQGTQEEMKLKRQTEGGKAIDTC